MARGPGRQHGPSRRSLGIVIRGEAEVVVGSRFEHPARVVPLAFLGGSVVGTILLLLPVSRAGDSATEFMPAHSPLSRPFA